MNLIPSVYRSEEVIYGIKNTLKEDIGRVYNDPKDPIKKRFSLASSYKKTIKIRIEDKSQCKIHGKFVLDEYFSSSCAILISIGIRGTPFRSIFLLINIINKNSFV